MPSVTMCSCQIGMWKVYDFAFPYSHMAMMKAGSALLQKSDVWNIGSRKSLLR